MKRRKFILNSSIASTALFAINSIYPNTKLNNNYIKGIMGSSYEDVEKNILSLLENEKERKLIGLNGFNIIKKYPQINFTKSILNSENS